MTEPLFPKLLGIQKHREVVERPQTSLEKLLDIEVEITRRYAAELQGKYVWDSRREYDMLVKELQERTAQLPYTARDLEDLVHAKINTDYNDSRQMALGLFSGALLDILTQRNRREGKETTVKVNGNDGKFNYLFAYARNADSIDVENFEGDYVCFRLGSFGGEVKKAAAKNIKGNWTLAGAGINKGSVKTITAHDITGDFTLWSAGSYEGSVKTITAYDITGNWTLWGAGSNGSVGSIKYRNLKGTEVLSGVVSKSKICEDKK